MAYPDDDLGSGAADMGGGSFGSKFSNLEGLVPLVLILIIAIVAGSVIGLWEVPFLNFGEPSKMLIIGSPSIDVLTILDADKDLVRYTIKPANVMRVNPKEQLAEYDLVMLDQTAQVDKSIPRQLGEALQSYVQKGGKLIIVQDSGIYREGSYEIVGWDASLGELAPVYCDTMPSGDPSCKVPFYVIGKINKLEFDHPIMQGIDSVVPEGVNAPPIEFETFKVLAQGTEIAYIQNINTQEFYPAIVEGKSVIGKVIYFNYNPGKTRGIFENTLNYLK